MTPLLPFIGLSALAAIACDWRERLRAFYVFKPLTTLLVIVLAARAGSGDYGWTMIAALVFCLAGDIALMGRGDRAFIAGLSAFLVGHVLFTAALLHGLPRLAPGVLAPLGPVVGLAGLALLWPRVGALRLPILAYVCVLLAMWLAADARHTQLPSDSTLLALIGASVFIASDSLLAFDRFVRRLPLAQPLILGTYFPAITLLALSIRP